jgi:hypothetical protein
MAKRSPNSNKREKRKATTQEEKQGRAPDEISKESEKPFDFGGLPVRDLKKNLGCG